MGTGLRRQSRAAAAAAALCLLLLGAFAGAASAFSFNMSTDRVRTLEAEANSFSGLQRPQFLGERGPQYWAYWSDGGVPTLVRRAFGEEPELGTLRLTSAPAGQATDKTNLLGYGISRVDGRQHVSYRDASGGTQYLISEARCRFESCRFATNAYQVDRVAEASMANPDYFSDETETLYFSWRNGEAMNGDQLLNRYDNNGRWTHLGAFLSGTDGGRYTYDPDGGGPARSMTTSARAPIVNRIVRDRDGYWHLMWLWRESTTAFDASHGINYAYSGDYGATWHNQAGRLVGTTGSDPITIADRADTEVVAEPPGYHVAGATMELDQTNLPHILATDSDVQTTDDLLINARQAHYWSNWEGTWYGAYIQSAGEGTTRPTTGSLIFDSADKAYALFGRNDTGWKAWNADPVAQNDLPDGNLSWQEGTNLDVRLHSANTALDTAERVGTSIRLGANDVIKVRMKNNTSARHVSIYWTTDEDPTWTIEKGQVFSGALVERDTRYTEYTFTITDRDWGGTLRQLEFYPARGASSGSVSIDSIKLVNRSTGAVAKSWEFNSGQTLIQADAAQANNWASWELGTLLPEVNAAFGDNVWAIDTVQYHRTHDQINFGMLVQSAPLFQALSIREFSITGGSASARNWEFDTDAIGWTAPSNISEFGWVNDGGTKGVAGTISGRAPQIQSPDNLDLQLNTALYVHVRMKRTGRWRSRPTAKIWYASNDVPTFSRFQELRLDEETGRYTTYTWDMGTALWTESFTRDKLRRLLLEVDSGAEARGSFIIDRIWIDYSP